jgi:hypothetical protein
MNAEAEHFLPDKPGTVYHLQGLHGSVWDVDDDYPSGHQPIFLVHGGQDLGKPLPTSEPSSLGDYVLTMPHAQPSLPVAMASTKVAHAQAGLLTTALVTVA